MSEQLSLIILVVALATGLITSIVAATYMQVRQPGFFRFFLTNILLFNLLILSGLVLRYLQIQFQSSDLAPYQFVFPGLLAVMAALKLGWLYAFTIMNTSLPADIVSKRLARFLAKTGSIIFLAYVGMMTAAWFMQNDALLQAISTSLETLVIGGALIATLQLLFTANGLSKGGRRNSILIFAGYHLGLLGIILAVLVISWLQPGPQRLAQLLANGGFLILFNLFPLIWMQWFQPLQPVSRLERFELLGISKREREIIGLIQADNTDYSIGRGNYSGVFQIIDRAVMERLSLGQLG